MTSPSSRLYRQKRPRNSTWSGSCKPPSMGGLRFWCVRQGDRSLRGVGGFSAVARYWEPLRRRDLHVACDI